MRFFFCCLILSAANYCCLATSAAKLKAISLFGTKYVDLHEWSELEDFELTSNKKEMIAEMTNRWARVIFFIDSKHITINDVSVWLSHATASTHGSIYVSERDLTGVITPLLFPVKAPPDEKIRKIALSAGHGGKDPGNQWGNHKEKEYTLLLSREVGEILEHAGLDVVQVRNSDTYVEPEDHAKIANEKHADLFVSMHFNSVPVTSANPSPRGVQTYCVTPVGETPTNGGTLPSRSSPGNRFDRRSVLLAYEIQKALVHTLDTPDLGVRRAGFMVLRKAAMPGVLVEGGFMSNAEEAKMIYDSKYRREMAQAIADGILAYKRMVEH
jgi:N-acetylmuramoyl-L-alanine amidase